MVKAVSLVSFESTKFKMLLVALLGFMLTSCGDVGFNGQATQNSKSSGIVSDGDQDDDVKDDDDKSCEDDDLHVVDSDSRAPRCAISSDTPIYADGGALPKGAIRKGDIASFDGAFSTVYLVADSVGKIGAAAGRFTANARSLGSVQGAFGRAELVAHAITSVEVASGANCISAQSVGMIHTATGALSLIGRNEGGKKATVAEIRMAAGFVLVKDYSIQNVEGAIRAKLVNSEIKRLSGAGELILQDSVIENLDGFAGKITCRGNSRIVNRPEACK